MPAPEGIVHKESHNPRRPVSLPPAQQSSEPNHRWPTLLAYLRHMGHLASEGGRR